MPPSITAGGAGITTESGVGGSEGGFWDGGCPPEEPPPHPVKVTATTIMITETLTNNQSDFCFCLHILSVHI
jgi:hypothetical protein